MITLVMALGNWVSEVWVLLRKLLPRIRTPSSSLQITVSGDNNDVHIVLPETGQESTVTDSRVRPARRVVPRSAGR